MEKSDAPITTIVRHFIKADKKQEFETWAKDISAKAKQVEGFESLQLISPPSSKNEYIVLFKFASTQALQEWMSSGDRITAISKLGSLSAKEMVFDQVEGIDFWFDSPEKKTAKSPPNWKMSVLTWLAVFPGVVLLSLLYRGLFPELPALVSTLLLTLTLVPLLTWVLMPNLVKLFKGWLYQ